MKKIIIGCFLLALMVACGSSRDGRKKKDDKANTETAKPQKTQQQYEEM